MCYIQINLQVNKSKSDLGAELALKRALLSEMPRNSDGFFVMSGNEVVKTMDLKTAEQAVYDFPATGLIAHCRYATQGDKTQENIHGYHLDKWQFLHNGFTGVGDVKSDKSDSLLFFEILVNELNKVKKEKAIANVIQRVSSKHGFIGRAVLIDKEADRAFLFGDFKCYLLNKNYIAICSAFQRFDEITRPIDVAGLVFGEAEKIPINVAELELEGVYIIDRLSSDFKFRKIREFAEGERKTTNYNFREYRGGWDNGDYDNQGRVGFAVEDRTKKDDDLPEIDFIDLGAGCYTTEDDADNGFYDSDNHWHTWDDMSLAEAAALSGVQEARPVIRDKKDLPRLDNGKVNWDELSDEEYWHYVQQERGLTEQPKISCDLQNSEKKLF